MPPASAHTLTLRKQHLNYKNVNHCINKKGCEQTHMYKRCSVCGPGLDAVLYADLVAEYPGTVP